MTPFASGMLACTAVAIANTAPPTHAANTSRETRFKRRRRRMPQPSCLPLQELPPV
jgi:hypothetical protein